ncbi:hypothetical protein FHR72_000318 [Mycolicibacterium iranicum]|uniref:Pyrrolo-quinoline quinone n=1 Tax=Mycolicibacterium iranicum TaxID=912594 RepID=A0A839Q8D3_MYCIR|nr:PQQ-binding-like beta-propeller repeat protein [Mycolicibacterium iranicum]MBB2988861.1 hypothetical protein [Mycolicibacterium iranicum]
MGNAELTTGTSLFPRSALLAAGSAIGGSVGAALLGGYAFMRRLPPGLQDASATRWMAVSGLLIVVGAGATIWISGSVLRGTDATRRASWLLTVVIAAAAYAVLGSPDSLAAATPTAVALLRLSWVVMAIAAILLVAAAVCGAGHSDATPSRRRPTVAAAVTLTLVLTVVGGGIARARTDTAITATPSDIPAVPTAVGTNIAYSLPIDDARSIVPAGPGFAVLEGDAVAGYAGDTGHRRWRFPLDVIGGACEPSSLRSTGTAADAVVIVQCLRGTPSYSSTRATRPALLTGIDAMTGRVLWTNGDNWRLRSTTVTGADVVPVLRGDDIGSLDPHTGKLRWVKHFGQDGCEGNLVGLRNATQDVVYFPVCAEEVMLHVVDGRTGDERTVRVDPPQPGVEFDTVELAAAAGDVVVLQASSDDDVRQRFTVAVDVSSGDSVRVPVEYLSTDRTSSDAGHYPGEVLQLTDGMEGTAVYLVAQRKFVHTTAATLDDEILDGQRWALIGGQLVTATAMTASYRSLMVTADEDGAATVLFSPCGGRYDGGVIPVPGAVLVVCAIEDYRNPTTYEVVGVR